MAHPAIPRKLGMGSLASATRDQRENILRDVEKQAGDVPFTAITRQKIVEGREKRKATPNQANNFIEVNARAFPLGG